jgi:peptide/nickel transport system permease protein
METTFNSGTRETTAAPRIWQTDGFRRFMKNRLGVISLIWLLFVALASIFGPLLTHDPNYADVSSLLKPPSWEHPFGTDHIGRDMLARILMGGRVSLTTAIVATLLALVAGFLLGATTGYVGGSVDELLSRIFDILTTFPTLLLGILVVVILGPSLTSVIIAVAISYVPIYGRLFRAGTLGAKKQEYVLGVVALGISPVRVMIGHILPNIMIPVLVIATGNMGRAALAEASLSFIGAGVQPPDASWGNMMAAGQPFLQIFPWYAVIPGTILTSITVAFSFVGDALRDAFDLRETSTAEQR